MGGDPPCMINGGVRGGDDNAMSLYHCFFPIGSFDCEGIQREDITAHNHTKGFNEVPSPHRH